MKSTSRVVSDSPVTVGTDNGSYLVVNPPPTVYMVTVHTPDYTS
ncbi:MAG: hypothetical protein QNK78_08310 [Crocinitomicaceae bacterium]|nr:hypothetical protein [Crocinitomicaceae bacterium]MDC0100131.1 hypothetical protein [Crocinitomicaceae bacterium]